MERDRKAVRITRRSFIKITSFGLLGLLSVSTASFYLVKRENLELLRDKLRHNQNPYRLDTGNDTEPLLPDQMKNIVALSVALIPWEQGSSVVQELTRDYVNLRSRYDAGARQVYADTSELLDREAFRLFNVDHFYSLNLEQRHTLISEIMPPVIGSRKNWRHAYNLIFRYEETRSSELVMNDILIHFYTSDEAWRYLQGG